VLKYGGFAGSIQDFTIASHHLITKLQPGNHLSYPSAREVNATQVSKCGIRSTHLFIGNISRVNRNFNTSVEQVQTLLKHIRKQVKMEDTSQGFRLMSFLASTLFPSPSLFPFQHQRCTPRPH